MKRTLLGLLLFTSCRSHPLFDVVLRDGLVCDGSGHVCQKGGVAINGDSLAVVGDISDARGRTDIDVHGQVIAPGFINMMSNETGLFADGRALSDLTQGVTLEIFGEGESMGPLNDTMRAEQQREQGDIRYNISWHSLLEGLDTLAKRGISPNIASFVGAATPRVYVLGRADRTPTQAELDQMCAVTAQAMEEGALGVASALIYAPGNYAQTSELIALAKVAAQYKGMYISHIRNEGNHEREALDEFLTIARQAHLPAEVYHLKVAGVQNWPNEAKVLQQLSEARAAGLDITADMYTYTAGETGLDAAMPPWVQAGGLEEWRKRLQDPLIRKRVAQEMRSSTAYDNLFSAAGSPDRILLIGFKSEKLKPYTGMSLAEVSRLRHESPEDTAMDLVVEDDSRVETVYFLMSEDNLRKQIVLPWVSFASDSDPQGITGVFQNFSTHPRTFGNFARVYAEYVRKDKLLTVSDAIRKMTSLPATNLGIDRRGMLKAGYYADVTVFDPATIQDHATYEKPRQLSTGVSEVFVNGKEVVHDGVHTGATPGRALKRFRG